MASVRPWSVRAEGEIVPFPQDRVEGWARFDTFFQEEHERLFKALYFVTGNRADAEELMQEETLAALVAAGLPADYQTVPTLNFRNIASEAEAEKNLKLLDNIYASVTARLGTVLSEAEVAKFKEFRSIAINGNQMTLSINRKMMAPGPK